MKPQSQIRPVALLACFAVLAMAPARAQQEQMMTQMTGMMSGMAANAEQLKQYTWKQRVETYYKDDLKNAKIDQVHYNASGERVSIPLDEQTPDKQDSRPKPPRIGLAKVVGKRVDATIESKQQETKDYIARMMSLTSRYMSADGGKLQAALAAAETSQTPGGRVRVTLRNYIKAGDTMTLTFDPAAHRPVTTEITTTLDADLVSIVVTFDQLSGGTSYPERSVVKSSAKNVEVRVFTYDYQGKSRA
jgi:hypothetical protein